MHFSDVEEENDTLIRQLENLKQTRSEASDSRSDMSQCSSRDSTALSSEPSLLLSLFEQENAILRKRVLAIERDYENVSGQLRGARAQHADAPPKNGGGGSSAPAKPASSAQAGAEPQSPTPARKRAPAPAAASDDDARRELEALGRSELVDRLQRAEADVSRLGGENTRLILLLARKGLSASAAGDDTLTSTPTGDKPDPVFPPAAAAAASASASGGAAARTDELLALRERANALALENQKLREQTRRYETQFDTVLARIVAHRNAIDTQPVEHSGDYDNVADARAGGLSVGELLSVGALNDRIGEYLGVVREKLHASEQQAEAGVRRTTELEEELRDRGAEVHKLQV